MSNAADLAKIQKAEKELAQLEGVYAELATDASLTAASMAPPPAGTVADVVSIGRSLWKGDWGGALLDVVGIIPIVGDGIKGVTKGTKIANKMKDVNAALKAARVKLAAAKQALKKTPTNPKNNIKKSIKDCGTQKCDKKISGGIIGGKNTGPIKPNEVTTYDDFRKRSVVGDELEGHEVLQHANLKNRGLATTRLSTDASKNKALLKNEWVS